MASLIFIITHWFNFKFHTHNTLPYYLTLLLTHLFQAAVFWKPVPFPVSYHPTQKRPAHSFSRSVTSSSLRIIVHVLPCPRTSSDHRYARTLNKLLDVIISHLNFWFLRNVTFISENHYLHILPKLRINFLQPRADVIKWLPIRNVKYNYNAVSSFVISVCDCAVTFLSRSIPNLEFNCSFVYLQGTESLQVWLLRVITKSTPMVHR
jgi:hypothetical protein